MNGTNGKETEREKKREQLILQPQKAKKKEKNSGKKEINYKKNAERKTMEEKTEGRKCFKESNFRNQIE